jgi:PAS domain S-box-containing protein
VARHLAALAGEPQSFPYQFRGRWFEILVEPLTDEQGRIEGCIGTAVDVTEHRRVEEELAISRRRLEEAQRVAHVGSFEWDVAGNAVTWSDELYRIYGLERGQFDGTYESFLARVHPADLDYTKSVVFEALRVGRPFTYDHRIVRPDGAARVLHTRGDVIVDESGRPLRLVGSCWDVTELKESTDKQARALSLLEATIHATADGLLVVDREGRVAAWNQRLLDLWKLTAGDVERFGFDELLAVVHAQLANAEECLNTVRVLQTRPGGESFDSLRFHDGRFYERYSRPQRIGDEVVGRVWSYRDVTDRERLLRRAVFLADASRLLASLDVEPALDGVAHLAVPFLGDGCAVDLLGDGGPRRLIAVSRDPARPIHPEVRAVTLAGHASIHAVGPHSYMAVPLIIKHDVIGAMTFVAAPERRYTQQDLDLAEELARRAALSVENARLYRGAQEALRARDEFLSIAAHELRGPLTSLHLAVQGLRRGRLPAAANDRVLELIEREDLRLARFVDELLDVGRIRSGQLRFDIEQVDLAEVVREVAARSAPELARAGSSLSIAATRAVGQWDRFRLEQVVGNLLSNAIRFGLGKPIEIAVGEGGGRATVAVKDGGIGIPLEKQKRIFEPFERAVSMRHYGGLGLGLYIVRTIVEGLGGGVRVASRPGGGATFTVELPQSRPP